MSEPREGAGLGGGTKVAALVMVLVTLALLATAGWLWTQGWRRRLAAPTRAAARVEDAPRAAAHPSRRAAPRRAVPLPVRAAEQEAPPGEVFQGRPVAWSLGQNQAILCQERPEGLSPSYLVILTPDYEVLGTLYLGQGDPVLPSRFLVKDASWGQARHFGGQDVRLGLVACPPGTRDGRALRDAVGRESWWGGKALSAFQVDF